MTTIKEPNPGSKKAIKAGCLCSVVDNMYGAGQLGVAGSFIYSINCPIHGHHVTIKEKEESMVPDKNGKYRKRCQHPQGCKESVYIDDPEETALCPNHGGRNKRVEEIYDTVVTPQDTEVVTPQDTEVVTPQDTTEDTAQAAAELISKAREADASKLGYMTDVERKKPKILAYYAKSSSVRETAEKFGIARSTLHRKLVKWGVKQTRQYTRREPDPVPIEGQFLQLSANEDPSFDRICEVIENKLGKCNDLADFKTFWEGFVEGVNILREKED